MSPCLLLTRKVSLTSVLCLLVIGHFPCGQEEELRAEVAAAQEATAAARRDAEAEKERFKKVIQELKRKLDRCAPLCMLHAE